MAPQLSNGAIVNILSGVEVEDPILQVISFKFMQTGQHLRYRVRISDGEHFTGSCMLATQLNELVNNELKPNSIILVERYICNNVSESKKILIILDLKVLKPGDMVDGVIGTPTPYDPVNSGGGTGASNSAQSEQSTFNRVPLGTRNENKGSAGFQSSNTPVGVHPIASLTPYQNKWTICARVTNKSDIRTWSNSRGQGKLFSMDLLDESGEIRATAFNDQCDKFYNMIEIDKVYYITQAQLKTANKQYSSLKNDYEMTFNQGTQVTLCQQKTNIPAMQFQFVNIEELEKIEKDATVDIIGVCKEAEEISTVVQKSTGKELKKRDLQIVDETSKEVRLTMWGTQAEKFDGSDYPIVAVKGVKVSDFNGKSLSVLSSSTVQINPDIKESHRLRAWYEKVGNKLETVNLSNQRGASGGVSGGSMKTIGEANVEGLGCGDKADYYTTKGIPSLIRKENSLYPACPSEGCNKKVIDMNNGVYRCEKCNREYDNFKWRLMLSASVADTTDSVWVTMFQDQAETILGCSSADLGIKKEHDENGFQAVFSEAAFKEYIFTFRVKMETYNDENRIKTTAVSVQPLDYKDYNKKLVEQIKKHAGLAS